MSFRQPGQLRPRHRQPAVPPGWTAYRGKEGGPSVPSSTTTVYSRCFPRSATGVEYCAFRLLDVGTLLCVSQRRERFLAELRVTPPRCVTVVLSNRPRVSPPLSSRQPRAANIRCYGSLSWLISDMNYICRTWFLQEGIASFLPITPHCAMPLKFIRAHMKFVYLVSNLKVTPTSAVLYVVFVFNSLSKSFTSKMLQ